MSTDFSILTPSAIRVYLYLMVQDLPCEINQYRLACMLNVGISTLSKALKLLRDGGFIKIVGVVNSNHRIYDLCDDWMDNIE